MINLETKDMACVKCPARYDEWQMVKDCIGCGFSGNVLKGEVTCTYYEQNKKDALYYIRTEMNKSDLKKLIEERKELFEIKDTKFYYNPDDIKITDDILDYMQELAECTKKKKYIIVEIDDEINFIGK